MRTSSPSDHELVTRIHAGDTHAFDTLVTRYYRPLTNLLLRYVDSVDIAEDILQDIFVRLWERRTEWREAPTSVRAYLYAITRNAALDTLRRSQTRARIESRSIEADDQYDSTMITDPIEREEFSEALQHAIGELPDRGREIYILSHQHGLTYREIAETLDISIPTVKTHMGRAIAALERKLRRFLTLLVI